MEARYGSLVFERPGHSTVRIETGDGDVIYIDPWRSVLQSDPHDADVVFCSHDDRDHYDPEAIKAVSNDDTTVVVFDAIDTAALEHDVVRLAVGGERSVTDIHVRAVPAYNRPEGKHVRSSGEPYHREGSAIGLVLTINGTRVYYCSDTDALPELEAIEAEVVVPPIGGRPTMDQWEAAALVVRIGPDLVLPVHYNTEGIDDIEADPEAFKRELEEHGIGVVLF